MDRKATILSIAMPPMVLAGFILGYCIRSQQASAKKEIGDKVREASLLIQERYYGETTDEKLERGAMEGLVAVLDPYSQYFTKRDYEDFRDKNMVGTFSGVGILVEVDRETGYLNIVTPIEDSPAFSADILPGDKLIKVGGEDIKGQPLDEVVGKIKGDTGTEVKLTFWRKGRELFDITLKRAKITIVAVKSKMVDGRIGYVRISDFTEMLPQFDKAIGALKEKGMKALVVDLRFNGGGLLDSAFQLSDRFVPKGKLIVSTRGRQAKDRRDLLAEDDAHDVPDMPVVILTNGGTASASEIFAGCLRDHGRDAIVGARTYGKGSVQTPFILSDGSSLKITTARYFTPDGTSVHREEGKKDYGLDPDHLVEMTNEEYAQVREHWRRESILKGGPDAKPGPKDLQLDGAVEVLNAKLDNRPAKVEKRELSAVKQEKQ